MVANFYEDLNKARAAEELVYNEFKKLDKSRKYELVGDIREYFNRGDIKATDESGREIFIEVKDDSRIADTGNVLCEDGVYYNYNGAYVKGNMYSNYDIYCVVSKANRKIYVIDFKVLRDNYKLGIYKEIGHSAQTTYCYLLHISIIKKLGGLIATLDY